MLEQNLDNLQDPQDNNPCGFYSLTSSKKAVKTPQSPSNSTSGFYNLTSPLRAKKQPSVSLKDNNESVQKHSSRLFFYNSPGSKDTFIYERKELEVWDKSKAQSVDEETKLVTISDIHFPHVIDTEFGSERKKLKQQSRYRISTQIKGIGESATKTIFLNPEIYQFVNKPRELEGLEPFPLSTSQAHFVDYLVSEGVKAEIKVVTEKSKKLPIFYTTMYAHFATAELLMVFDGGMRDEILSFLEDGKIKSRRRLFANSTHKSKKPIPYTTDWVEFERHTITIGGIEYAIRLRIIDTCAIHGVAGYGDIAKNVGWKLLFKDNFTKKQKSNMLDTAMKFPKEFEDYSLGDLDIYEILDTYNKKWMDVYYTLGLRIEQDYYQSPKLTIGGTVKDLFLARLAQLLGITDVVNPKGKVIKGWRDVLKEKVTDKYLNFNPTELRQLYRSTKCLLSKVEGGRCRNNRPTDVHVARKIKAGYDTNLICDIDISGCYGEGQRNQLFIIGVPVTLGFEIEKHDYNEYPTLRKILKQLGVKVDILSKRNREDWLNPDNWGELLPGCWSLRMSTSEQLKYGQDVFASWFTQSGNGVDLMAKFIKENENINDSEVVDKLETVDFDEEYGTLKILEHEIHNGVLTHDGLQWLLGVASARQRNELLDKCLVLSLAYYPRSEKIEVSDYKETVSLLDEKYANWKGRNTANLVKNKVINVNDSCHSWVAVNIGELIINDLLIQRKKAQITHGKKSPLDQLFKLCVNTLYGDMVSKYFVISNPIVGNNITARARMLAWYMEKGFNGWQSITDGCGFLLNEVLKGGRDKLNGELTISDRNKKVESRMIPTTRLSDIDEYLMDEKGEVFISKNGELTSIGKGENNSFINQKAWEHLQNEFPCVDILHNETTAIKVEEKSDKTLDVQFVQRKGQFSFETKSVFHKGAFHGSANYIFSKSVVLIHGIEAEKEAGDTLAKELKQQYPHLDILRKSTDNPLTWEITEYSSIKMRGYEIGRTHQGYTLIGEYDEYDLESFIESERYSDDNNPAKDFMIQLIENPERIERQTTAIKEGIVKVSEYQDHIPRFKEMGLVPGDTIKKAFLMSEFSLTQFTFKNYEQFIGWNKACTSAKDKNSQSIESFFLNPDGSLNFERMTNWVYEQIQNGVNDPFEVLDPNRHKARASKTDKKNNGNGKTKNTISINHPSRYDYEKIKDFLRS